LCRVVVAFPDESHSQAGDAKRNVSHDWEELIVEKRRKGCPRAPILIACGVLLALGGGMGTVMALN
jgi:hypothetical protein